MGAHFPYADMVFKSKNKENPGSIQGRRMPKVKDRVSSYTIIAKCHSLRPQVGPLHSITTL